MRIWLFVLALWIASIPHVGVADDEVILGRCEMVVLKVRYLNGPCKITVQQDGSFVMSAPELELKQTNDITDIADLYFAYVLIESANEAVGYWNDDEGYPASHAHSPLGVLTRNGACWQNENSRLCAWR